MWTSRDLKYRAKQVLFKVGFLKCVLAVFICSIVSMLISRIFIISPNIDKIQTAQGVEQLIDAISGAPLVFIGMMAVALLVSLAVFTFIDNPINVGLVRFFNEASRNDTVSLKELAFSFVNGLADYLNIVKVQFMKNLFLFLWGLVGIIPVLLISIGFSTMIVTEEALIAYIFLVYLLAIAGMIPLMVKNYQYLMMDYILADEPQIFWKDAFRKSKKMTEGQKLRMFKLNLSFIGWIILGGMLLGIGVFLVTPYIQATFSQLYFELKGEKILEGEILE